MDIKNKTILVTGATGFVGSHLVSALVDRGAHVIATMQAKTTNSYFFQMGLEKKVVLESVDVQNFSLLFRIITKHNVDTIVHAAAQPLVGVAYANPLDTIQTNVNGTLNILEAARLIAHVRCVVCDSSDKAYGKLDRPYKESDPLRGDHPYEVSKSAADLLCRAYYQTYHVPVVVSRFGNIYGEGDLNFSRIIPGIAKALALKETLILRSNGRYVRDYLYVGDVVAGYIHLAEKLEHIQGEAFNFGSRDTYSVLQLIKVVEKELHTKIRYVIQDAAQNEIPYQTLSYARARKVLGWKPRYTLTQTVPQIMTWYEKLLEPAKK